MRHIICCLLLCFVQSLSVDAQVSYMLSQQYITASKANYTTPLQEYNQIHVGNSCVSYSAIPKQTYNSLNNNGLHPIFSDRLPSENADVVIRRISANDSDDDDDFGSGGAGNNPGDPGEQMPVGNGMAAMLLMTLSYAIIRKHNRKQV